MMIVRQEEPHVWLDRNKKQAAQHLKNALTEWINFCKIALDIQASKLWKQEAKTWHDYVRATWNIDSSRIRQYKAAMPYAEKIVQMELPTLEGDIRKMKAAGVKPDDPNMPKIWKNVVEMAQDEGKTVQKSFFAHAKKVYDDAETTGGFVDVGEESLVPIDHEGSTKLAIIQSIDEAQKRNKQRLLKNKTAVKVRASKINGMYQLIAENGESLPDTLNFTIWMENKNVSDNL